MSPSPVQSFLAAVPLQRQFILVVEDIMGSGKTEAAFALAARMLNAGHCDGVFMGLPTMTTADSQASRQAESYRLRSAPPSWRMPARVPVAG
jgi:CRISPR-associated endonuclease/helicase Cas3